MNLNETHLSLVQANEKDISVIAQLAEEIWYEYYPAIISREQIQYMLNKMYSVESLTEQITAAKQHFYLIQLDHKSIGFISVSETTTGNWMLHKFYLLQAYRAKGCGSRSFHLLMLKLNNPDTIRLTVNRINIKSINFYFKNGFYIEKTADFDIGNGFFMNDFIMLREKNKN